MTEASINAALNDLLINVSRSLLQYVGECWPWTRSNAEEERRVISQLVARQKQQAAELAAMLQDADWDIDFGTYPTEYTDLHYVAMDYLLDQLVENQEALVSDADGVLAAVESNPAAKKLVGEVKAVQQSIAGELQTLVQDRQAKTA